MTLGIDPVHPIRREAYCAARSCGYGPSSAYVMARYSAPDRVSVSRNAQRLESDAKCSERISYLIANPDEAIASLASVQKAMNKRDAVGRNAKLDKIVAARKNAKVKREAPKQIAPTQQADKQSLADLLELILDESRAIVDRCRAAGSDILVVKSAIDLHRSAVSARERFLSAAADADSQTATNPLTRDCTAFQVYANMQRQIGETPSSLPEQADAPESRAGDYRDEEHLRFNASVTLGQIDQISTGKIPSPKDQIRLYEALLKSVVKLSQIINRRATNIQQKPTQVGLDFDPKVILRWIEAN